jgi:hypothetical protein
MTKRENNIDVLRGISIMIMFYAHLLPFYIETSSILTFERIVCSSAAPIFLFLLGYNFNEKTSFKKTLTRGIVLLLIGVFIDVFVFSINPFFSFDIMYLIGTSVFILRIIVQKSNKIKVYISFVVLLIGFLFQFLGFYQFNISEPGLGEDFGYKDSLLNFLFNGWFPIFPWLVFPIFGNLIKTFDVTKSFNYFWFVITFMISGVYYFFYPPEFRSFSVEIFYPSSLIYLIFGCSVIILFWTKRMYLEGKMFNFLSELGRVSLFLYAFHLTIYQVLFSNLPLQNIHRVLIFFGFSLQFLLVAYSLNWLKRRWPGYSKFEIFTIILGK